ncbi:fetuin B [Chanos chanos]|uniref:Fetuin B n=1 Tax=Chanos chanos TaxID=29144 RepID=A0A6J2WTA8_CHACN|nr:histidine-rich glycoprotein-like [Chanos chanos]
MQRLVLLVLAFVCVRGAPVDTMKPGSCQDASALNAAGLALTKINEDRTEGYVFSLDRLSNVNQMQHGPMGVVFYLTLDVLETKCHVLSKKDWRSCEVGTEIPVYGQCKATIFINKVKRVVRLYRYSCTIRPAPASKISSVCPDCPTPIALDNEEITKTVKMSMEKFNKESGLFNYFAPLNVIKASSQGGIMTAYFVEFLIQETVCSNDTDIAQASKCELMTCEFAHKGLCRGSHSHSHGEEFVNVECDIFEPEAAEVEKKRHLLGGETDHSHTSTVDLTESHDHAHDHTHSHTHAHAHDHSHDHDHAHDHAHDHSQDKGHHHTHEHGEGHGRPHGHDHAHDHAHDHDHVHAHHAKAHDHSQDQGEHHHHKYAHGLDATHDHDHEHALDHEHKHRHLHEHEHHHHHHDHTHEPHVKPPEGMVKVLPSLDQPMTLPSFPDEPAASDPNKPVTLPFLPDPEISGEREPVIQPFPTTRSPECPAESKTENVLIRELFAQDPLFKSAPAA